MLIWYPTINHGFVLDCRNTYILFLKKHIINCYRLLCYLYYCRKIYALTIFFQVVLKINIQHNYSLNVIYAFCQINTCAQTCISFSFTMTTGSLQSVSYTTRCVHLSYCPDFIFIPALPLWTYPSDCDSLFAWHNKVTKSKNIVMNVWRSFIKMLGI